MAEITYYVALPLVAAYGRSPLMPRFAISRFS
jgi:hypothetical protein